MKDFTCCNLTLPSLHDLLQHYEEHHAQQVPATGGVKPFPPYVAQTQASTSRGGQQIKQDLPPADGTSIDPTQTTVQQAAKPAGMGSDATKAESSLEMEAAQEMEMDDIDAEGEDDPSIPAGYTMPQSDDFSKSNQQRVPPLDLEAIKMANVRQAFQGIRQSTAPSTPLSGRLYNNPTVSSVNTPTINANPRQRLYPKTPDTSIPGTPAELDPEFLNEIGNMSMDNPSFMPTQPTDFSNFAFAGGRDLGDLCIDDPAKLLSKPSAGNQQAAITSKLGDAQYGPDSEVARNIRERQMKAGLADTVTGLAQGEEPKPFRCPVIGCEKAYKNQNGLKYHKLVSRNPRSALVK
jgi:transcription factor SFP1